MRDNDSKLSSITLLYCEDDRLQREVFLARIGAKFKKVIVAEDGKEGLVKYAEHKHEIDCILTDINMPKLDGFAMAKKIKDIDYYLPVIIMSGFGDNNWLARAITTGVNGYFTKPASIVKVLASIGKAVVIHEASSKTKEIVDLRLKLHSLAMTIREQVGALDCTNKDTITESVNLLVQETDEDVWIKI